MKKSKLLFAICIACNIIMLTLNSNGQAPSWHWAKGVGGTDTDYGNAIAVDATGNSYAIGYFESPLLTFGNIVLTNVGGSDIFIAKYDPSGNVLWAKNAGGVSNDYGASIAVDPNGNSYITGSSNGSTITFGSITLANSSHNLFVAKYDSAGNALWARNADITYSAQGNGIAVDAFGNSFLTGSFKGDSITFDSITLVSTGMSDLFIAKFDVSGNAVWAKSAGGSDSDGGNSIAVDINGNSYVTGGFNSDFIIFGTDTLNNSNPTWSDFFIAKYDTSGNLLWVKGAGGYNGDYGSGICVDANGNSYVTGNFSSYDIDFGTTTLTNYFQLGGYYQDIFIAKYDSSGNALWAKGAGGNFDDYSSGIAVDAGSNSYLTGHFFAGTSYFDSITITSSGAIAVFIAKYDAIGNVAWAKSIQGSDQDYSYGISANSNGNIYITGHFYSDSISFDGITLLNSNISSLSDIFIAKLDSNLSAGITDQVNSFTPIFIYPNPTSGIFTIKTNSNINSIEVYNVIGEKFYSKNNLQHQTENQINLSKSPSGIYFVKVYDGKEIYSGKVVID